MAFRALPEYIVEDIVNYLFFAVQYATLICVLAQLLTCTSPGLHQTSSSCPEN